MKKLILAAAVVLAGCAAGPKNPEELQEKGVKQSFVIQVNYQQAYRNFKRSFDQCVSKAGLLQTSSKLDTDLYTDIEEGRMVMSFPSQFGSPKPIRLIIIKRIDDQESEMTVYQSDRFLSDVEPIYRKWVTGEPVCK